MSISIRKPVKDLSLDLHNFRNLPQKSEADAVRAMLAISPDYFWGLMDSILDDGYLPTENIIVLDDKAQLTVKEGNRRIAIMKLLHNLLPADTIPLPAGLADKVAHNGAAWRKNNMDVPCAIYPLSDAATVDRIVTLTHGKGEKASRNQWASVARARHNRDMNGQAEPGLDLLEKYFTNGSNVTQQQIERWAGDYPVSVLDEAIKKLAPRVGATSAADLAKKYPGLADKAALDNIVQAVGLNLLKFAQLRDGSDFGAPYGLSANAAAGASGTSNATPNGQSGPQAGQAGATGGPASSGGAGNQNSNQGPGSSSSSNQGGTAGNGSANAGNTNGSGSPGGNSGSAAAAAKPKVTSATAVDDQATVRKKLRSMKIVGLNRAKLVTLQKEMRKLTLKDNPIAFCFLLRSMFEISGKAYCDDHAASGGPSAKKKDGNDKSLADLLRDVVSHLTQNSTDKSMLKVLHGAITQLAKQDGILSVTSMNALVHNPTFTITEQEIGSLFGNIFPLLEEMNK